MGFFHRKLLETHKTTDGTWSYCFDDSKDSCVSFSSPPPPPPSPNHAVSPLLILLFCVLGVAFLFISYITISTRFLKTRRRNSTNTDETRQDFIDEDHGPVVDHPIWLINTVGLEQSVIDSIAVFKYKKEEKLIEGTECSVCLSEFHDDESLRLLPQCSHAFHVPCIDTWLRAHKNCPLCRALVVCDNARVITVDQNLNELGSREEIPVENLENVDQVGDNGTSEMSDGAENVEEGNISEILEKNSRHLNARNSGAGVLSDLTDHRGKAEEEALEPVRRSVSMNSSAASMVYFAVANVPPMGQEGCSDSQLALAKKSNSQKNTKGHSRSSSTICKRVMKSSSYRFSLQKGPVFMKRSYSSHAKSSQPSHSRSQDSI